MILALITNIRLPWKPSQVQTLQLIVSRRLSRRKKVLPSWLWSKYYSQILH